MKNSPLASVVLAAGKGQRMVSDRPKVLHEVAGQSMLSTVLAAVEPLAPSCTVVVIAPSMEAVAKMAAPHGTAIQEEPLGTGHAVKAARVALQAGLGDDLKGQVLVLYGDTPLITTATLERMLAAKRAPEAPPIVALGFETDAPGAYGRMVLDRQSGRLAKVVEAADADTETLKITLCNGGVVLAEADRLFDYLDRLSNDNPKGEYYLTDIFEMASDEGTPSVVVEGSEEEVQGVNSRLELAQAETAMQLRLRDDAMTKGVTLIDPATVWFSADTVIAPDVIVEPSVFFGPGVCIASGARIRAFSHLEGATVGSGAVVGPYARLRPGAVLETSARVGNFVEVKNTTLGEGAKANHLTYLGDAEVGPAANVGAGTITCNYDGFGKHRTTIGAGAFIGSNTSLVAPVSVGAGAIVGAGSTITSEVGVDDLAIARGRQVNKPGFAAKLREHLRLNAKMAKKKE